MSYEYNTLTAQLESLRKTVADMSVRIRTLEAKSAVDGLSNGGGQIIPKEQINNAVATVIQSQIQPQIDNLRRQVTLNSDSGAEELVMQYRQRVNSHYNPDTKQLTDGKKSQSSRMTFFTDAD